MSPIEFNRCPQDEPPGGTAQIGINPNTQNAILMSVHGVSSVLAIQSAMMTLSAAMRSGHEKDFLEKVALSVFGKLTGDPHALCPLFTVCSFCLMMLQEAATIGFDENNNLFVSIEGGESVAQHGCVFDYNEEDDHGTNETNLDGPDGPGDNGGGPQDNEGIEGSEYVEG